MLRLRITWINDKYTLTYKCILQKCHQLMCKWGDSLQRRKRKIKNFRVQWPSPGLGVDFLRPTILPTFPSWRLKRFPCGITTELPLSLGAEGGLTVPLWRALNIELSSREGALSFPMLRSMLVSKDCTKQNSTRIKVSKTEFKIAMSKAKKIEEKRTNEVVKLVGSESYIA